MNVVIVDDDLEFAKLIEKDVSQFFSRLYDFVSIDIINDDFKR